MLSHIDERGLRGMTLFGRTRTKCATCGSAGVLAHEENVDPIQMTDLTYASRKPPELMHYELFRCLKCGLLFSTYVPEPVDLFQAYESAGYDSSLEAKFAATAYFLALKRRLHELDGGVLDVGCGDGQFLQKCRDAGIDDVAGIEPSSAPHGLIDSGLKESIFKGPWEAYTPTRKFGMVTLFQTIEHLTDPGAFLDFAAQILRKGGRVAIASHNSRGLVNKMLGTKSPIFDIEHLQLFSKDSLNALLEKHGFRVLSCKEYWNFYPIAYLLRLAPIPVRLKTSRLIGNTFGKITLPVGLGNLMTVAEKV